VAALLFPNRSSTWHSCIRLCDRYVRLREKTGCLVRSDFFGNRGPAFRLCFIEGGRRRKGIDWTRDIFTWGTLRPSGI